MSARELSSFYYFFMSFIENVAVAEASRQIF